MQIAVYMYKKCRFPYTSQPRSYGLYTAAEPGLRFDLVEKLARELSRQKGVSPPPLMVAVPADVVPTGDPKKRIGLTD